MRLLSLCSKDSYSSQRDTACTCTPCVISVEILFIPTSNNVIINTAVLGTQRFGFFKGYSITTRADPASWADPES